MVRTPPLEFTSYDVTDLKSLAPYFSREQARCGIYVLRFDDGMAYVGQTGDVLRRFSSHHRDWARKRPAACIERVEFAPCAPEHLDAAERGVIAALENDTGLLNKLLTNWPGGHDELTIRVRTAPPIRIPATRSDRPPLTAGPSARSLSRFVEYTRTEGADLASDFAASYLSEAMPSPVETAGSCWTCTALPSTNGGGRLFTLSVGGLETVFTYLLAEPDSVEAVVNVALPTEGGRRRRLTVTTDWCAASVGTYRSEQVWSWRFDLGVLMADAAGAIGSLVGKVLNHDEELDDLAYALNRRLMARRPSMWAWSHNEFLAAEFLTLAAERSG